MANKSKKGKGQNKSVKNVKANVAVQNQATELNKTVATEVAPAAEEKQPKAKDKTKKVVEVKAKDVKKDAKAKKPNKIAKSLKDTGAELKKVTWPKFSEVVKQTGIVLVVVLVFALVLFGLDMLCSWLTKFLY